MIENRPFYAPNSEFWGHNFQDIGPENIANYFEVSMSRGTRKEDLQKVLKEFGDDVEIRFVATQNYKILIGNELHEDLIANNNLVGEKVLRGVAKLRKSKPVKILEVPSETAQFFKAKMEHPDYYQKALDIISNKVLKYIDSLKT